MEAVSGFKDENCILCKKDIPSKKTHLCCEFCGNLACEKCMYKTRKFKAPHIFTYDGVGDISFQNGQKFKARSGLICIICDRKFWIYNHFMK
jgi:hypothetical protein